MSAAAVLGLTQKTVKWLVAEGHLESVNGDMRRYGIVKSSVDRLLVEYEPTDTYAPKLGCSPRIAAYRLAEMGVRVIKRGPSDAGSGMASGRGLAHRDDLARVFPRDLETVAVCSELVDGWERLRAAALTSEGCWVLPAILSAAEMRLFMSSMKLAVTLRFGRAATLTADCSPSSAVRRSRILDAARPFLADRLPLFQEVGPGGWLLVSEIKLGTGATTVTEAHATWLRDALSSLGRMFASRDAV